MTLEGNLRSCLLCGKHLSEDKVSALKNHLFSIMLQELHVLAKDINVRLAGSSHKADIVDRMIGMVWVGAIQDDSLDEGSGFCGISYITDKVRCILHGLPEFLHVKNETRN